jgi:hypothetical protein
MPDKAQLTSDQPITWSDGALFNGYVVLSMNFPSLAGSAWTTAVLRDTSPRLKVPKKVKVPIK